MSEPKRVTFETISSGSSKNLAADATAKNEKTLRFELKLFEPNTDKYPLFNFKALCQAEKVIYFGFFFLAYVNSVFFSLFQ